MTDEYADYPTKVFIDSNIILEALPLKDLPWFEIDPNGPILIILTPTLLSEVDSKKRDGRLGVRAREFNRLVAPIATSGLPINLVEGALRIDIDIAKCNRIDWSVYDDLDSLQGDARIIAETLNVKGVLGEQKVFVSQDLNPIFMAQRHGLKTHHVSDNWLPQIEPHPLKKEIIKLKNQLATLSKTEPEFKVKLIIENGKLEIHNVCSLTDDESSEMVNDILTANPKPRQLDSVIYPHQYDSSLDERYSKYTQKTVPNFVQNYHKKIELLYGQVPFTLEVKNIGDVRADHTNIDIQIQGGWFNKKPIFVSYYPSAPSLKNPMSNNLHFNNIPKIMPSIGRHEIEINEPKKDKQFSAQCENFMHGQEWVFSGVVWLDPHYVGDVIINVTITASNLHGKVFEIYKPTKFVTKSHVFELVDPVKKKILKSYYIQPLIDKAIKAQKFDSLEFDS